MDPDNLALGSYPVLEGVAPDSSSSATFEHLESVEVTLDTVEETPDPHDTLASSYSLHATRPVVVARSRPLPRRIECHHSSVTRQWRVAEYETCDTCGVRPFFRWFYLCTEDTTDFLASNNRDGSFLSAWVTEAIIAGEYTDAQRDILIKQKIGVQKQCERVKNLAQASMSFHQDRVDTRVFEEQEEAASSQANHNDLESEAGPSNAVPQLYIRPTRCHHRACYHCDRRMHERAWLSLNAVCDDPEVRSPTSWDIWDTPVSDVNHVRNLGLRKPTPPRPPPHDTQYVYRAVQHRQIPRASGNYLVRHNSSINVAIMTELSTIEEDVETAQPGIDVTMPQV
ncbi:hypothetical protein BJX70DRAFT_372848 [Aspergillus crustosus]